MNYIHRRGVPSRVLLAAISGALLGMGLSGPSGLSGCAGLDPLAALVTPALAAVDARALVRHVETQYEGHSAHCVFQMKVVTASWTRTMTLESWSQGRDRMLARILAPMKDAGMSTLKVGDQMWEYFPNIDRLMRIPTSLMGQRWMGSDLTNDDLVKASKIDQLYTFKVSKETPAAVSIVATPKPDAAVVWGHLVYVIDPVRELPVAIRYYDENGALARTVTFSDARRIDGRWLPMKMRFEPADRPGEYTEVDYRKLELDRPVPGRFFSVEHLGK